MRTLTHHPLCPFSRKVRVVLAEKKLDFQLVVENWWERRPEFLALNPMGEVPVLVDVDGSALADATAIAEYLDEISPEPPLLPGDAVARAEIRRLVGLFDGGFYREVTLGLVGEKLIKRLSAPRAAPDSRLIGTAYAALRRYMDTIAWLTERRTWLAGPTCTLADITAAAHLSCLDFGGEIAWEEHPGAKEWYARIKSRPSFRPLLADQVRGIVPPKHYANLDF